MSCQQIKQSLWDYYDEATPPSERLAVEAHLAGCRECRATLDEWIALSHSAFRRTDIKAPAFLWTRVLAAIESQESEQTAWWRQWQWMSRLATVMTLLVSLAAGIVFYQNSQGAPVESLLNGITNPESSMQVLPEQAPDVGQLVAWLVESPGADKLVSAAADETTPAGGASWKVN